MKTYHISIEILATRERVWTILTEDLFRDPGPFGIVRIQGSPSLNGRIKVWSEVDPKRAFALKVTALEAPHKMVWRGGMPFGLFTGERTFLLTQKDNVVTFDMQEVFSGALSGLIVKSIPDLTPSFEKFASTLKERAESHE